jgi:hypothetical protein
MINIIKAVSRILIVIFQTALSILQLFSRIAVCMKVCDILPSSLSFAGSVLRIVAEVRMFYGTK